jgi:hypothetical protein
VIAHAFRFGRQKIRGKNGLSTRQASRPQKLQSLPILRRPPAFQVAISGQRLNGELSPDARRIVEQEVSGATVGIVRIGDRTGRRTGIEWLVLQLMGCMMPRCKVAAVVEPALLPAQRTRDAALATGVRSTRGAAAMFSGKFAQQAA